MSPPPRWEPNNPNHPQCVTGFLGLPESLGVSCLGWNGIKLCDIPSFGWLLKNKDCVPISPAKGVDTHASKQKLIILGKKNGTKLEKHIANIHMHPCEHVTTSERCRWAFFHWGFAVKLVQLRHSCSRTLAWHKQCARSYSQVSLFLWPS